MGAEWCEEGRGGEGGVVDGMMWWMDGWQFYQAGRALQQLLEVENVMEGVSEMLIGRECGAAATDPGVAPEGT